MKLGYLNNNATAAELLHQIEQQKQLGVSVENITINKSFDEFIDTLPGNHTIVIPSYDSVFSGLEQLIGTLLTLCKKEIYIESMSEPMLCPPNSKTETLELIQNVALTFNNAKATHPSETKKAKRGRPLGSTKTALKITEVDQIRQKLSISIEKACRVAGCQPRTYYRHKAKEMI